MFDNFLNYGSVVGALCLKQEQAEMEVIQGIVIGAVGGACATITATLLGWITSQVQKHCDQEKLYDWLSKNSSPDKPFRSTRTLASWNNLSEDRVRYVCSSHTKIYLSTGNEPDLWSVQPRDNDGFLGGN